MNNVLIYPITAKNSCFISNKSDRKENNVAGKNDCANFKDKFASPAHLNHRVYNYNIIPFKGYEQSLFSAFINSGSKEIYNFLCKAETATPAQVRGLLYGALANDSLSSHFIKEITANPRESSRIVMNLSKKLGGVNNFRDWYFRKGGYRESFGKYVGNYYYQAKNIDELFNLMPNWKLSDVVAKYHKSVSGDVFKGGDPLIGRLPKEFGNEFTDFPNLINTLRKQGSDGELYINSKRFKYRVLKNSDEKAVYEVVTEEGKSYIIKIDKVCSDYIYSRLRANSIYIEAMIGKYLTMHKCKDVPRFYFYDFFHNASVFENISGKSLENELNPLQMNRLTPDLLTLGIRANDTHMSNYLQTENGFVNIDLGNASYFDLLKPGDIAHTIFFPNYTGLDLSSSYSGIDFAKFVESIK